MRTEVNNISRTLAAIAIIITVGTAGAIVAGPAFAEADKIDYSAASERLVGQGEIALSNDDGFGALLLYEQAIVANPQSPDAFVGLGQTHVTLGNVALSLKYFGVALEIDPVHLGALEGQALVYLSQDEVSDAEDMLVKIKRICGDEVCDERKSVTDAIAAYLEEHVAADNAGNKG